MQRKSRKCLLFDLVMSLKSHWAGYPGSHMGQKTRGFKQIEVLVCTLELPWLQCYVNKEMRARGQPWSLTCQGLRRILEDWSWIESMTETQRGVAPGRMEEWNRGQVHRVSHHAMAKPRKNEPLLCQPILLTVVYKECPYVRMDQPFHRRYQKGMHVQEPVQSQELSLIPRLSSSVHLTKTTFCVAEDREWSNDEHLPETDLNQEKDFWLLAPIHLNPEWTLFNFPSTTGLVGAFMRKIKSVIKEPCFPCIFEL